jgi:uncharacterized membrane protein YphA (DoxX/SURF4 family)
MRTLRITSRIIIGLVFIFSGIVKAIDPLGFMYKFHDYFQAFHIGFLNSISLPLAILMCTAEFVAGISIISGIRQKAGIWLALILMVVFTPITFILALTNPVSDCGCFGDAVHLTNWKTFGKNIILAGLVLILFITRKQIKPHFSSLKEWLIIIFAAFLLILFSLINLRYLPAIDFLPYKTGVKIAEKMVIPEGVPSDKYVTTFFYEKNGVQKEFDLNNYPKDDSTWKFVNQRSVLVKKGYQPPIHDFSIRTTSGEDITQQVLSNPGYSVLMVTKKLKEANRKHLEVGFILGKYCIRNGIMFYILTSSGTDETISFRNGLGFFSVDETTLKTMVRANPGYILIKDGVILKKWSWANIPEKEELLKLTTQSFNK